MDEFLERIGSSTRIRELQAFFLVEYEDWEYRQRIAREKAEHGGH